MADRPPRNRLLVEGVDEVRIIPELMEANGVAWGETRKTAPVDIEFFDGIDAMLAEGAIETESKASGLRALGILADTNTDAQRRWSAIRNRCPTNFTDLPDAIPREGLIAENERGMKLGVWLMPDNVSPGMMETFLRCLVPDPEDELLAYASETCKKATKLGAPYKKVDVDKARIHAWLAWQDAPGRQLHDAIKHRILAPDSEYAGPFVSWFRKLFGV